MKVIRLFFCIIFASQLAGCAGAEIAMVGLNALALTGGASAAERHAKKCYDIEMKAEADKASKPETRRRLTAAECPS